MSKNQFPLTGLEVFQEFENKRFHQLGRREQLKIETYTLRCVMITNDSHPEIKFDVFERLNTNTVPLSAQELRNCVYRGRLNNLLSDLAEYEPWLKVLGRSKPDTRMRDEELILRFLAFHIHGVDDYSTPLKRWLNAVANEGREYSQAKVDKLGKLFKTTIDKASNVFPEKEVFRRIYPDGRVSKVINRALMDLSMSTLAKIPEQNLGAVKSKFLRNYRAIQQNDEFQDPITKSIDHKSRTTRRFELWQSKVEDKIL